MDKRTLLAVVLSVVIISVGFMLQSLIWPADPKEITEAPVGPTGEVVAPESSSGSSTVTSSDTTSSSEQSAATQTATQAAGSEVVPVELATELRERTVEIQTDLYIATLSSRGGELVSLKLKEQLDDDLPVDMIFSGESEYRPFFLTFGGYNDTPIDAVFEQNVRGQYSVAYSREFLAPAGSDGVAQPFTLIKTYTFTPGEHMFELEVTIENGVNEYPNLDFNGFAYTLGYGPQIGPSFDKLGGRGEYRYFYVHEDGKRKTKRPDKTGNFVLNTRFNWVGIAGKYFAILGIADDADYTVIYNEPRVEGLPSSAFMYFSRPVIRSSRNSDVYRFYAGPKLRGSLSRYNDPENNPFGLADRELDDAVDSSAVLGWLEAILKFFLDLFYRLIPNYGIAIILLTIFVKVLLFPITRKSYQSTSKMQALNPQITEIREKFKDNPNRMNQEMAALYKREKVSPLGGCLPLLLQMPMFLAMYRVMSSHFALRGARFFWWITDLSEADSIFNFAPVTIPLLGWTDIRLLPIIFVGTQIISSKMMQQPGTQTNKNMKLMSTLLPVFFFFILYSAPSGLLLYWIMTNVLTSGQQKFISYYQATHPSDDKDDGKGTSGKSKGPKSSGPKSSGSGPKGSGPKGNGPSSGNRGPGGGKKNKPKT